MNIDTLTNPVAQRDPALPDEHWQTVLERACAGDADAFGDVWANFLVHRMRPLAASMLRDADAAEDVLQDVFEYLFSRQRYRHIRSRALDGFSGYVHKVVKNMCIDELRARQSEGYWITDEVLAGLAEHDVGADVCSHLRLLQQRQRRSAGRQKFIYLLTEALGPMLTAPLQALILQACRQARPRQEDLTPLAETVPGPDDSAQEALEQAELQRIVAEEIRPQIADADWAVFEACYTRDDFTYRQYAAQTGSSVTTLHTRCQQVRQKILAHKKLRAYWQETPS